MRLPPSRTPWVTLAAPMLTSLLVGACPAARPTPHPDDGQCFIETCADVPDAEDPCLPACGNPIGVGQPCTAGGGECNRWSYFERGEAGFCSLDFRDVPFGYCSRPCEVDHDCGCGARCVPDPDDANGRGCRIKGCEI